MVVQWKPGLLWQPQGPIDLQEENACYQHNSFSFDVDRIFLKLADKVDMDEIWDEFKTGQIKSLILELLPLDCWKASVWLCHQHNSFNFDRIILTLADKMDMDEIWDEFENWPNRIIYVRVTSPWLLKKPLFDFVISISHSVLIGSS